MHLPHFEYSAPASVEELVALLKEHGEAAKILAGGTDLLPQMLRRDTKASHLLDLQHIAPLKRLSYEQGIGLTMGAAVTIEQLAASEVIKTCYHALYQGAQAIGSPQVRAMASIGGNSCNASPCADTPPPLIALGATVELVSHRGKRKLPLEEFILGNREVALARDEVLESFHVPQPSPASASRYTQFGHRAAMEINLGAVAVHCAVEPASRRVTELRIVMGSVAPTPLRARRAEAALLGNLPSNALIDQSAALCAEEAQPIDDLRASAEYRRDLVAALFRRTFREALAAIG
ncbi:MAG: xanthine dehydrogenase family protein subunit M [Polyangiaceae bacterium]|jgi:carbon-monoxide dehydrogenase medium subunit|nr:xanthine dehydrogenase family protein subunit M [Polyangiaceae bacterium]